MVKLNVEKILKEKGKSKECLCDMMDISHYNLNRAIMGKTQSISFKYLQAFCKALNCTFDELLTIVDDEIDKQA